MAWLANLSSQNVLLVTEMEDKDEPLSETEQNLKISHTDTIFTSTTSNCLMLKGKSRIEGNSIKNLHYLLLYNSKASESLKMPEGDYF
jgi:hypothetical protein